MDSSSDHNERKSELNIADKTSLGEPNASIDHIIGNTLKNPPSTKQKRLKCANKLAYVLSLFTVEPVMLCYVIPTTILQLATQHLYIEKACRVNLNFGDVVCDALAKRDRTNYTIEEQAIQKLTASVTGWKFILQSCLPCGILMFIGAYSDKMGSRKFCMLLPITGEILGSLGLIMNTYFFYELPVEAAAITQSVFLALTGGWYTIWMGIFSYISDITTEEVRTVRMGIVLISYSLGIIAGSAVRGIIVRELGLYGAFSVSVLVHLLGFIYTYLRIKGVTKSDWKMSQPNITSMCDWLHTFFDLSSIKDTFMVAFQRGPNNRRTKVIMLTIVMSLAIGPIYGEIAVTYLFTRYKFNWDEVDFSVFSTYATCITLLGTLFSISVFSHFLKFDDAIIGLIASSSKILGAFMYAFASNTWQIYSAPLVEVFHGAASTAARSMLSKTVEKHQLGKVNSIFGVAEAITELIYVPMYTSLYSATLDTLPGAFYLLGGGLTLPTIVIFIWLYVLKKKFIQAVNKNQTRGNQMENITCY